MFPIIFHHFPIIFPSLSHHFLQFSIIFSMISHHFPLRLCFRWETVASRWERRVRLQQRRQQPSMNSPSWQRTKGPWVQWNHDQPKYWGCGGFHDALGVPLDRWWVFVNGKIPSFDSWMMTFGVPRHDETETSIFTNPYETSIIQKLGLISPIIGWCEKLGHQSQALKKIWFHIGSDILYIPPHWAIQYNPIQSNTTSRIISK